MLFALAILSYPQRVYIFSVSKLSVCVYRVCVSCVYPLGVYAERVYALCSERVYALC